MATLSVRKAEREAMFAALVEKIQPEDEDLDLFMDMAGDLLKVAYNLIRERDLYVCGQQLAPGAPTVAYGWFSSLIEAKKFAEALPEGTAGIVKVFAAGDYEKRSLELQQLMDREHGDKPCASCQHKMWEHGAMKFAKGVLVNAPIPARTARCSISCACPAFAETKEAV